MKLKIGDNVRLNNLGLSIIFGNDYAPSYLKTKVMKVIRLEAIQLDDADDDIVTVDDPEIGSMLLFTSCFDLVK